MVRPSAPGMGQLWVTSSGPVVTLSLKTRKTPFTCTCVSMDNAKNPIPSVSISCAGALKVSRDGATPKSLWWARHPHVKAHGQRSPQAGAGQLAPRRQLTSRALFCLYLQGISSMPGTWAFLRSCNYLQVLSTEKSFTVVLKKNCFPSFSFGNP